MTEEILPSNTKELIPRDQSEMSNDILPSNTRQPIQRN